MRKIAFPTLFYILAIHYSIKYTQKKGIPKYVHNLTISSIALRHYLT